MIIKRKELLAEYAIRQLVRKELAVLKKQVSLTESFVRRRIRKLLREEAVVDTASRSTGINVLEDLLKSILPNIEDSYKMLTTSDEQRESFLAHLQNGIKKLLNVLETQIDAPDEHTPLNIEEAVTIAVQKASKPEEGQPEGFIDIDPEEKSEEEQFGIDGMDITGRNVALDVFKRIENQISDAFTKLSDQRDREEFSKYLLINLKLYSEKWDSEMHPTDGGYEDELDPLAEK